MNFLKKKSFESVKEVSGRSDLPKTMTAFDLIMLGLGGIIGTGVFVLTGLVAAQHSGPAVMLSYAIAGVTCIFVALAYTELASMLPTSGSIYTYSYVAFGEVVAWLMGGVIILEMGVASSAVATGWSGYIVNILDLGGLHIPTAYTSVPSHGGIVNIPAMLIVAFVAFVLYLGTKDSKRLNAFLVFVKMAAIGAFIFLAVPHFEVTNWDNFMPFGFHDVLIGSSILFFAFTGFGTLAAAAEECQNPKRDLTIGIIGSLLIAMTIYIIVGGLATGIVPFTALGNNQPLAEALKLNGSHLGSTIVSVGAVFGMTTVIMANIYGISRIFYVMARDGLLPPVLTRLHPKHGSPHLSIFIFSTAIALLAGFCPLEITGKMSSAGALIDYTIIMVIVMVFRLQRPDTPRPFKCPALFVVAPIGFLASIYLLSTQIISKDGRLLEIGRYLIYWGAIIFALYLIRGFYMGCRSNPQNK
ncbi:MAG: amino acid permease [Pseudomonadota bacterium]